MTVKPIGYYEKRWGNKMTTSGLPDLHIVINGWSFEVEIKAPNGKVYIAAYLESKIVVINTEKKNSVVAEVENASSYTFYYEETYNLVGDELLETLAKITNENHKYYN